MTEREELIADLKMITKPATLEDLADALIAAGWCRLPSAGPAFDAAVERAARAIQEAPMRSLGKAHIIDPDAALSEASVRAAKAALRAVLSDAPATQGGDDA